LKLKFQRTVTFWQTASLLHLSTARHVTPLKHHSNEGEYSSLRAGPAHQDNARSYHPRHVSHTRNDRIWPSGSNAV